MADLLTFKQFISEGHGSERTVGISPKQAFESIAEHCSGVARQMKKQVIYRGGSGMSNQHPYHGNSNVGKPRRSANTANYFTLWHDSNPEWAAFPKRSRSFICANDYDTAYHFGDVHIVVPYDNAHVGVVPEDDLFSAITSPDGDHLGEFNDIIRVVLTHVERDLGISAHIETYKQLIEQLKLATRELIEKHKDDLSESTAIGHMDRYKVKTYLEVVEKCYSPKGKGFKEGKAASITLPKSPCEVYVQGEAIFLPWGEREADRKKFEEGYMELLEAAIEKYSWNLDL